MRQLEPSHYGLQLRKLVDENVEYSIPAPYEYMQEQVYDEIEVFPLNVYGVQLTKTGGVSDFGLRKGNEIMTLNGEAVSALDLKQMEALFSEKSVELTLTARPPDTKATLCSSWSDSDLFSRDQKGLLPPPNQSQLLEEFLDNFKKDTANDFSNVPDVTTGLKRSQTDGTLDQVSHREMEQPFRSAEQIAALCRGYNDTQTDGMEGPRESQDPPPRPLARHLSDAHRLRKVIQELMDTEKSYVKVTEDAVTISCSPPVTASCMYVGRGLQVSAGDPATHQADACSLKWRAAEGEGERTEELRGLAKIRFPGRFVTKVAFTMETDVLVCHLQSVGREPVPV
ncbi:rho guanine nucleotide exchange factor TIAM2 isoform X3 [Physeter macrocephalus]|uniref:Rho guanine nucleotide exchange factor TIAM2 isoform X3 n=1 Tax=Physeter macrocephalus TaxID=9755 RepID=A0A455BNR0_PHYMC|nr:rho guanine nucleotide exchange factor TIAM2 isoform X3 [Physeter catodon]|eukprot:XP_028350605.1 T-lymphoma invasion and metastasis-inducing protein 2 isoform X2 [Physeter catodon]